MTSIVRLRCIGAIAGFALFLCTAGIADAANLAGTWAVTTTLKSGVVFSYPVCAVRQAGDEISGTCKGPAYLGAISGAVDGQKIVFEWRRIPSAGGVVNTQTFRGALGADGSLRGTWIDTGMPGVVGVWTAHRVK